MRRLLGTLSALGVVSLASASPAAVTFVLVNRGTPVGSGGAPVVTGYTGYTLRLVESTGANITAVDMESGENGLFGPFVQRWTSSGGDGVYDTPTINLNSNNENLTNSVLNFDSHLLQPGTPKADANYVGKIGFVEDLGGATFAPSGSGVPPFPNNSDSAGIVVSNITGSIQGAFGINGAAQSSTLDLAYVVLPNSYTGFFGQGRMLVAVAGSAPQVVLHPFALIPEPAGAGLLAGSAWCLTRRRRHPHVLSPRR
jgi:hypothetical protein